MTVRVNMDARSKGGKPVPDGDYVCEVVSIVVGESSQKKSPQLNVQLEVHDGPFANGRLLDFIPLSENSAFRAADFFYACGVDEPGENDIEETAFCRIDAEGNAIQETGTLISVRKTSQEEEYQGKKRMRARLFYSRVSGEVEAEATEEAEAAAPAPTTGAPKPALASKKPVGRPPGKAKIVVKA